MFWRSRPTVCVTRAGRAAERRPTGKMLRRRKMLGIAPESPASGARFVGQCLWETVCVTRAGRAAERRPTGKMLRRRKMLGIAPESPASGARFVGQCLWEGEYCFTVFYLPIAFYHPVPSCHIIACMSGFYFIYLEGNLTFNKTFRSIFPQIPTTPKQI